MRYEGEHDDCPVDVPHDHEGSELIEARSDFALAFSGEAYETFQRFIGEMQGYGVTVTTQDGEVIEGYLAGLDPDEEWGDHVKIVPCTDWNEPADGAPARTVRVGRVEVH